MYPIIENAVKFVYLNCPFRKLCEALPLELKSSQ